MGPIWGAVLGDSFWKASVPACMQCVDHGVEDLLVQRGPVESDCLIDSNSEPRSFGLMFVHLHILTRKMLTFLIVKSSRFLFYYFYFCMHKWLIFIEM